MKKSWYYSLVLVLISTLALTGCQSKKKKGASDAGQPNVSSSGAGSTDLSSIALMSDSDSGKAGTLKTVYFAFNSSSLTSASRDTLKGNAEWLKANPSVKIDVEGHCDERGGIQYNIALGDKRAKSIKKYLTALGVESNRVRTISFGKERPLAFGHDESSWSQNRRGNFVITEK
ncbi:MAG: peptidoglycan-associated lipoprotein Pal [Bacteriovoracaceae bacterium]